MPRILFIYNPRSGTGKISASLSDVADIFTKNGYEVTVYPTQSQGDCTRRVIAAAEEDFDRIVAAGGDGMMHELVAAIAETKSQTAVGYIPTGTVNDFASTHSIPKTIPEAAENAVRGKVVPIDAGRFNETYFSYVAAFGSVAQVSYNTNQRAKNLFGSFAYFLEGLKSLDLLHWQKATSSLKITAGNMEVSGDFIFGAVTNTTSLGGIANFLPEGTIMTDGLLEGIFVKQPTTLAELEQIRRWLFNRSFESSCVVFRRSSSFRIEPLYPDDPERKVEWTLDGEYGGEHDTVDIEVLPLALNIALPGIENEPAGKPRIR